MRIPITNLLLLGTALAAPVVQDVDRASKATQHNSLITRGILSLIPRVVVPVLPKPVTPKPVPHDPVVAPHDPAAPVAPGTGTPDGAPAPLRPGEGTPAKPQPDHPGIVPPKPESKPAPAGGVCGLKRAPGDCIPYKDGKPGVDAPSKYEYEMKEMDPDDIGYDPMSAYLEKSNLGGRPEPAGNKWYETQIGNSAESKTAFEASMKTNGAYEAKLKEMGWSDADIKTHFDAEVKKHKDRETISYTYQNPKKGGIVIKESYNKEYDFHREYTGETTINGVKKTYTRPAIDPTQRVQNSDMVIDNWMVACKRDGVDPKTLNKLGLDNVETPEMRDVYASIAKGKAGTKEVRAGPELNAFLQSQQGRRFARMLDQNKDLIGPKKITGFDLTFTPAGADYPKDRYDSVLLLGDA
ncbi:hypothetical protein K458DRAFT_408028 [Lentithecium fluviatile CBS 122367]|uniref:ADP-ribosylation n=1 Tax=Lentithecium fluviatile CBS 122367 TaxID=1168545 RepID=A0A6G1IMS6_9PLEO|nr:hypothetical protein K458DRAFT_408028 [Lentithecium fluviatile CBS 122367]